MRKLILLLFFVAFNLSAYSSLKVAGSFNGWNGETIVKLNDGSYWIQAEYTYKYCYQYSPNVQLFRDGGRIKMLVEGCGDKAVAVEQITRVIESRIAGEFKGWDGETIFKLQNGSVWQQSKYEYWYKYAYNPECLVYFHNGWKLLIFDKTISVRQVR